MTNAPYLMAKLRCPAQIGQQSVQDSMFLDGLEDAYDPGRLMGSFAEDCAKTYQFACQQQDGFALASLNAARQAQSDGVFAAEIAPVTVTTLKGAVTIDTDEQPVNARPEKSLISNPLLRLMARLPRPMRLVFPTVLPPWCWPTVRPTNLCGRGSWGTRPMLKRPPISPPRRSQPRKPCYTKSDGPFRMSICGR